jgi:hypothetical protein
MRSPWGQSPRQTIFNPFYPTAEAGGLYGAFRNLVVTQMCFDKALCDGVPYCFQASISQGIVLRKAITK